jgi:hypothetical protein
MWLRQSSSYASCVAAMTGAHHPAFIGWDWSVSNFLPRLASNHNLPNLSSKQLGLHVWITMPSLIKSFLLFLL